MDEKVLHNVSTFDYDMMNKTEKTIEEVFAESHFEWVKTEREGEISKFKHFLNEHGVDYVVFQDDTRVRRDLVGDVVLMHSYEEEILNTKGAISQVEPLKTSLPFVSNLTEGLPIAESSQKIFSTVSEIDPVVAILEKTKKKNQKITLTLNLKIPAPSLYNVIKENFENVEEVLLESVMDQIHDTLLRESLRKELQSVYQKRKRTPQ